MKSVFTILATLVFMSPAISQNVGIGTTTPTSKLEVVGKIKADSVLTTKIQITDTSRGAGKVLKSDSVGLASWGTVSGIDILSTSPAPSLNCPVVAGSIATGNFPLSIALSGNYAYVANPGSSTMQVININNPALPVIAGSVAMGTSPVSVAVSGNYAYVTHVASPTMKVVNISNPASPVVVGSVATNYSYAVAVSGNYVYVGNSSNSSGGMQVINVSNPASPIVVGSVATGNESNSIAVLGNYAYVANSGSNTMQVIDISNPASPIVVGSVVTGNRPISVAVSGNYAYVVNYNSNTMQVINISNPASPIVVGSVVTGNAPNSVAVSGNSAYVVNSNNNNMKVINISNPASPVVVGSVLTGSVPNFVAILGNYAYVANSSSNTMQVINLLCNLNYIITVNPSTGQTTALPLSWNTSGLNISNANVGNVGIGTTTPKRTFIVKNDSLLVNAVVAELASGNADANFHLVTTKGDNANSNGAVVTKIGMLYGDDVNAMNSFVRFHRGSGTSNGFISFSTNNDVERMRVDAGGNVGIGTTAPAQKLEVSGTTKTTGLQTNSFQIISTNTNGYILKSDATGNATWVNANTVETDPKVGTLTSNKMPKWNGSTLADGIVFDDGTNIGIGTITPAQKLDVAGTIKSTSLQITSGATNGYVLKSDASGNASWVNANTIETDPKVGTLTSNKIPKWNGITLADGLIFDNGTNIGIGTITPGSVLHLQSTNLSDVPRGDIILSRYWNNNTDTRASSIFHYNNTTTNSDNLAFGVAGNGGLNTSPNAISQIKMVIQANGNVGIGTDAPAVTLDVNGGIKTKYSGSAMTSVTVGVTTPYQVSIPTLPAGWDYTNTVVLLSPADGVAGNVQKVRLTSLTNIDVYYQALQTGGVRFNWIIFKM